MNTQANLIDGLMDRVHHLESWRERRGRSSGGRSTRSPSSLGSLSYGSNPVPIPVPPPRRVEGFVGDGSRERPYTHVVLDNIEDLDNLDL